VTIQKQKILIKILSLIAAVILWIYVANQTSMTENTVNNTPLNYNNLADSLYIEEGPESVEVRVWGAISGNSEIIAYLDLEGLGAGLYTVPVRLVPIREALFVRVQPDEVVVRIGQQDQKVIPITYEITNPPPEGYSFVSAMILPSESVVQLPQGSDVVSAVVAPLNLTGVREMVEKTIALELRDSRGEKVDDIRVEPHQVKVYIVVEENVDARRVNIRANYSGTLSPEHVMGAVTVEPEQVTIVGPPSLLASVNQILTQPLSVDGLESDFTTFAGLNLPAGLVAYPSRVLVSFNVEDTAAPPPAVDLPTTEDTEPEPEAAANEDTRP
jgi:YbbR domain-containing protein